MAKANCRPPSSSSSSSNPEELMKLVEEEEEEEEEEEAFKIGIEGIIQVHLQTLKQSYNRIQKLVQTSLLHSYSRLGRIHEVENDRVVFENSSEALQKDIESSIQVAQNITAILKSILPRHTLDYVSNNNTFFLVNFSNSENLKVSKFQKKTDLVRNKIVEVAVKLYDLRSSRIKRCIVESVQYGRFRKNGTQVKNDANFIEWTLWKSQPPMKEYYITEERDEIMMKIEKGMKDLEGILFGIYVMVQTQAAINEYAISEKWVGGTGHHDNIKRLAAAEAEEEMRKKKTLLSKEWFKSKIDDIYCCCCGGAPTSSSLITQY